MNISNGTRQGAILSPLFWAVYADPLLRRLRDLGLGVHIAGLFVGAVCYCDDVLLIAPTRSAMQRMLLEMEAFANESNIQFSTNPVPSKSKSNDSRGYLASMTFMLLISGRKDGRRLSEKNNCISC